LSCIDVVIHGRQLQKRAAFHAAKTTWLSSHGRSTRSPGAALPKQGGDERERGDKSREPGIQGATKLINMDSGFRLRRPLE
jgi:hypothetical protein